MKKGALIWKRYGHHVALRPPLGAPSKTAPETLQASPADIFTMISAALRFLLLSLQAGYGAGVLSVAFLCQEGCHGYGSALGGAVMAIGVWLLVAIVTFILLIIHRIHTLKTNPQALEIQETIQWVWLAISFFIFVAVDF